MASLILNPNKQNEQHFQVSTKPLIIGRSEDSDIRLDTESVSPQHAKVEKRGKEFFVVDLKSETGTSVNGTQVGEASLKNGDLIQLGKVEILFVDELQEKQGEKSKELPAVAIGKEMTRQERTKCPNCGDEIDKAMAFCPRCGWKVGRDEYLPTDTFLGPVERTPAHRGAGILPMVSLILGIFGPLIFGIGWLLAIILGFSSLSIIRRRGGLITDRRRALWGINLGLAWAVIIGVVAGTTALKWHRGLMADRITNQISQNEVVTLNNLRNIALTEKFAKSGFLFDRDGDGISEYAQFDNLSEVDFPYYSKATFQTRENSGYVFAIHVAGEENFLCEAIPVEYQKTGVRTFSISADGYLRGADMGSGSASEFQKTLPVISGKTVYTGFEEEIAGNLLRLAEAKAKDGNYLLSKKIIEEIRQGYPLTTAQKELDGLMKTVDPFVTEFNSKEMFEKAQTALRGGDDTLALSLLRRIEENYPTCSIITSVKQDISNVGTRIGERLGKEAKALSETARAAYQKGDYEKALECYKKIQKDYASTEYFRKNAALLTGFRKRSEGGMAEQLLVQIRNLSPERDYQQILRLIDILKSGYSETEALAKNESSLRTSSDICMAYNFKKSGLDELAAGNYRNALAHLEKAVAKNPDFRKKLKEAFKMTYLKVGDMSYEEKDYRSAVQNYEKYLQLAPKAGKLPVDKLADAYYQFGRIEYENGNLDGAQDSLLKASLHFEGDVEFNYLLANVFMKSKKYEESIPYFSRCIDLEEGQPEFHKRRGLSSIASALCLEAEIDTSDLDLTSETKTLLNRIAGLIAEVSQKFRELEPVLKKASRGDTRVRAKLLKHEHLEKFLGETANLRKVLKEGKQKNNTIVKLLAREEKRLKAGVTDLRLVGQADIRDYNLESICHQAQKKQHLLMLARQKLQPSLRKEISLRNVAFALLENKLTEYQREYSFTGRSEEPAVRRILDSDEIISIRRNVFEGQGLLEDAAKIEIPVEEYLSQTD